MYSPRDFGDRGAGRGRLDDMTESLSTSDPVEILRDLLKRAGAKVNEESFDKVKEFFDNELVSAGSSPEASIEGGAGDVSGGVRSAADPLVKDAKKLFDQGSELLELAKGAQLIDLAREAILGFMNESDYVRMRNSETRNMTRYERQAFEFLKKTGGVPPAHGVVEVYGDNPGKYFECTFCGVLSHELPVTHLEDCPR